MLKEALPLRTIVMVVLGVTGVLVILLDDILFSKEAVGQAEEEQARNTTLGNFICLLNPISWSFYWMIVRRSQKKRDVVAAANAAAQNSLNAGEGGAEPKDEEHWWDEMLAIQIVAALLTAIFSFIGMLATGWSDQIATVTGSDAPIYIAFGIYLPFVLLMFSLAPRYIATAEMGCIKMLGALPFYGCCCFKAFVSLRWRVCALFLGFASHHYCIAIAIMELVYSHCHCTIFLFWNLCAAVFCTDRNNCRANLGIFV